MVQGADGQSPQMYYDAFVNKLLQYDSDLLIGASPECETTANPLGGTGSGAVATAPIDWFLYVALWYYVGAASNDLDLVAQRSVLQQRQM